MRVFKNIQFGEGISCTLSEFKKDFSTHLKGLSEEEIKEAHKVATNGNNKGINKKSKNSKEATDKEGLE